MVTCEHDADVVLKAHRRVYHSTLGLRVIKKKKKTSAFDLAFVPPAPRTGATRRFRDPLLALQVARFRRAPVQIRGIKQTDLKRLGGLVVPGGACNLTRTSICDKYSDSVKITTHLNHISHCKTASGTNRSNRWTDRIFIINTRRD